MASVFVRRSLAPPRVWCILMHVPWPYARRCSSIEEAVLRNVDREGEWR